MPKREIFQRRFYAAHRASLAIDRLIRAQIPEERIRASRWAQLWGFFAQYRTAGRD